MINGLLKACARFIIERSEIRKKQHAFKGVHFECRMVLFYAIWEKSLFQLSVENIVPIKIQSVVNFSRMMKSCWFVMILQYLACLFCQTFLLLWHFGKFFTILKDKNILSNIMLSKLMSSQISYNSSLKKTTSNLKWFYQAS